CSAWDSSLTTHLV
nr:immunoglobulin light chain junction region [Macaca mulatta]